MTQVNQEGSYGRFQLSQILQYFDDMDTSLGMCSFPFYNIYTPGELGNFRSTTLTVLYSYGV